MRCERYFMINDAFHNIQCLLCYKIFKAGNENVLKRHFYSYHYEIEKINCKEKEELLNEKKKIYFFQLKEWLNGIENNSENQNLKSGISSLVSLNVFRHGRPFSDGIFIKEVLIKVFEKLSYSTDFIKSIPLSRFTLVRRTTQIGTSLEHFITEKLKSCEFFSVCLDESTDINDVCELIICIRCVDANYNVFETMFTLESFYANVTGKLLFDIVSDKLFSIVDTNKFAAVCTDGASVMTGRYEGFIGQLQKHGLSVQNFHCIIHQVALASKFLSEHSAMKSAERIINRIRGGHNSLTHRKFVTFLKTRKAAYHDLKMYTDVRWLSRGDCLNRLFDLRKEVVEFLELENIDICEVKLLKEYEFTLDLAFLSDITNFLNEFNLQLQGKDKSILDMSEFLLNFKTKLFLLLTEIRSDDFSSFTKTSLIYNKQNYTKKLDYVSLLETLFFNFEDRFNDFECIQPLLDVFKNPLNCDISKFDLHIQSEIIILRSEVKAFDKINSLEFWKNVDGALCPQLKRMHLKYLSFFSSTYLCEQIFSDMKNICSKQRNRMTSVNLKNILLIRNCHASINTESLI